MTETIDTAALIADVARRAALAAGSVARKAFIEASPTSLGTVEKAGFFDLVTVADKAAEKAACDTIWSLLPNSRILGEEGGWQGAGDTTWLIDPIDGTSNFASGLPIFAISIAAYHRGRPAGAVIYDPMRDELFMAEAGRLTLNGKPLAGFARGRRDREVELLSNAPYEGERNGPAVLTTFAEVVGAFRAVRRLGSCALHLAYVATGRVAACYESKFSAWDIAAGIQLVQAAGGLVDVRDGDGARLGDGPDDLVKVKRIVVTQGGFDYHSSILAKVLDARTL
jgi:myo-inositol-1(or 4)-monophosphatase